MNFSVPFFRSLRGLLRRENACRRASRPAALSFRPTLEQLESRWVPCGATFGAAAGCGAAAGDHAASAPNHPCISSNFNCAGNPAGSTGNCQGPGANPGGNNHPTCDGHQAGTPGGCGNSGGIGGPKGDCGSHCSGSCGPTAPVPPPHQGSQPSDDSLSGSVLDEITATGQSGILVTLTGTNVLGQQVDLTTTTTSTGSFSFTGLLPGTYTLTETPVSPWQNDVPNNQIGSLGGATSTDVFSGIVIQGTQNGTNYNFENTMLVVA
ncbi:MAG TPA: SpaA isopeptide-forming pilin-related protein [Gemmataceae bacterium]|nr:SpaA isopeptide-forming pilin-related protein [Gemmataceae bacterium]